jgi:hypothetical protein
MSRQADRQTVNGKSWSHVLRNFDNGSLDFPGVELGVLVLV